MSSFTWLDYSEHERRQAMEVIDLFGEDETRDELGLGTVRDSFADLLFPGTSTIQTRARYFLFIPWVHAEIERKRVPSRQIAERSRIYQSWLRNALIAGGEEVGVIGHRAGLHVKRLPSSVYWYGLRSWGILRFDGTEGDYGRNLDLFYRRLDGRVAADGGEAPDVPPTNWDSHLPATPEDFLTATGFVATFQLSSEESEYLIHRIAARAPQSLLTHMLLHRQIITDDQRLPWEVPFRAGLSSPLGEQLLHARNFSEVMHGAALLYNLILAEQKPGGQYVEPYQQELAMWRNRIQVRRDELLAWDRPAFWKLLQDRHARIRFQTRTFIDSWINLVFSADARSSTTSTSARRLVTDQERCVKPGRARIGNDRAIESWQGSSGSAQLDYRWKKPVRAIVNDILEPLMKKEGHHA